MVDAGCWNVEQLPRREGTGSADSELGLLAAAVRPRCVHVGAETGAEAADRLDYGFLQRHRGADRVTDRRRRCGETAITAADSPIELDRQPPGPHPILPAGDGI